jgi:hypothetical protein
MHMTFDAKKLDPGIKQREYSLPNRLDLMSWYHIENHN